ARAYPGIDLLGVAMKEALQVALILVVWVAFWLAGTIGGAVLQAWLIDIGVVSDIDPPWIITIGSSSASSPVHTLQSNWAIWHCEKITASGRKADSSNQVDHVRCHRQRNGT